VSVDAVISLHDITPLRNDEIAGSGVVSVDHNYGGTDALTVQTTGGRRIDNATVLVFRQADYASGRRQAEFAVAQTTTDVDGHWAAPVFLDPGSYTLFVFKQGVIQAKTVALTVV
jgi:hypothetical protein